MKSTLSKALAAFALGVLGMLAFVAPSHAARFIAHIDPAFDFDGSTGFPNIGFQGTAIFNVPGGCLSGGDGWRISQQFEHLLNMRHISLAKIQ